MAVYCHYLTLLSILLFIWKTTALEYSDFEGLKYIILDKSSSNNGNFYSSLFDSKGNVDHDKLKAHSRERRSTPEQYALPSNTTRHGFPSATEYEFKGDNHTVAFLHWSGTKSQVIFIYTSNRQGIQGTPAGNVYFKSAYLWRSTNYGSSFVREDQSKFSKSTNINGIRFCDRNNQRVVVFDQAEKLVYVSDDEGNSYKANHVTFTPYDIVCVGNKEHNLLVAYDGDTKKEFDPKLGEFEPRSFEFKGNYLFVKDYHIFDASDDEVLVVVRHQEGNSHVYNLYVSDKSGTKYSLSLLGILASYAYHWNNPLKLADIHKVKSLRGVFLANTITEDRIIKTFITFDKGGTWNRLRVPPEYKKSCRHPYQCSLNLHMVHSMKYYQITSILSSKAAIGLIMAQGNIGVTLTTAPNVFLSTDGGLTWKRVLHGIYDFVFGDHGGLIVAVPLKSYTKEVMYSCTEGSTWKNVTLEEDVKAYGLVTEPGETTLVANIFGQRHSSDFEWLSVKLNLSSVFTRKCNKSEQDYTTWTPNDERMTGKCLMGESMLYERRRANVSCFNGEEYEREISNASCNCSMEDFMCDFGFVLGSCDFGFVLGPGECYSLGDEYIVPEVCPELTTYMRTSGYRKVPGDRCIGGIEDNFKANKTLCPVQAPSGLSIVLKNTNLPSYIPNTFNLVQEKGSTETTWYVWDFGDSTPPVIGTGIKKSKNKTHTFKQHGKFNVTVTANNSVGQDSARTVVKVIDEIVRVRIVRPHGVLVGRDATFNVSLYSNHPTEWQSYHGFVHFVWTFDVSQKDKLPLLTWERVVKHNYSKAGKYKVNVNAINDVSRKSCTITIQVHDEVRTVQLSFDEQLDKENKGTWQWREEFAKMVLYELIRDLGIEESRLEVFVHPGIPTFVEVTVIKRDNNNSLTMDQVSLHYVRDNNNSLTMDQVSLHYVRDNNNSLTMDQVSLHYVRDNNNSLTMDQVSLHYVRDNNNSLTMDQAVKKLKSLVEHRILDVLFPDGKFTLAIYAEIMDLNSGKKNHPNNNNSDKLDIRLPLSIGMAALVVVLFLAGIIFYVYRRYRWMYRRYHQLSMANGGDGFVPLNRTSHDSVGVNLNDEAVSYHVPGHNFVNMDDSDDELLLNDVTSTSRVLVINGDPEQDNAEQITNTVTA
ncbi:hypothetical protein QZH41_018763 [Actinostola sp. cb2023]|nr:hypothetical protein QZH41_018763 [Actinostola sp. cb2023]